ncbi:OmpW family outer membrane protein [Paraburkholderia sp. BL9I2N2]|uniref:OmpW/AlkL family protein n=1 Tax=Paraburkholderia sp. BL9I2N2 TaxID=1938809 RepID=UPI00104C86A0|nr:OmpW family outer membrane protein [Paraburkholderia sp. BL9I2N2]TCK84025.1 outer membrane protein [Paraburkholderia sp. BL9I2N2]
MHCEKIVRVVGMTVLGCAALFASDAQAQASGSTTLGIGWLRVMPQGNSDPTVVESAGGMPVNQTISGTGAHVGASNAVSLTAEHLFTDHIGVAFLAGSPFTSDLIGNGSWAHYGVIGQSKPLAPVIEVRYHFLPPEAKFRPFLGAGVNYTWYSHTRITNGQFIGDSCGPGCTTRASLSPSWNPVVEAGMSYALSKHWSINASVTYIPLSTTLTTNATTAVGTEIVTKMRIATNPLITHLDIAYTF